MTANVFREDIEKCLQAGMDDHIGKPLNPDDVLKKLRACLPQTQALKGNTNNHEVELK
jgi:CheY-like chemotaxis protein